MANDLNRCEFIGRLGKDPEARFMPDGGAVTNFSLAVGWKTKDKEGTEWVRICTFGKLAEICSQYLAKGKQVYVSGRMRTREYEKDGDKRYVTEVVADQMQMLGGRADEGDNEQPRQQRSQYAERKSAAPAPSDQPTASGLTDMDDGIPF